MTTELLTIAGMGIIIPWIILLVWYAKGNLFVTYQQAWSVMTAHIIPGNAAAAAIVLVVGCHPAYQIVLLYTHCLLSWYAARKRTIW